MSSTSVEPGGRAVPTGRAVRLTSRGLGLTLATVGSALLAAALGYRELTLLAAAGATALLAAVLAVARQVPLAVELRLDHPHVQRGDPARLTVTLTGDASRRTPPVVVTVARAAANPAAATSPGSVDVPALGRAARAAFDVELDTSTRGVVDVGPVGLRRTDRFGLLVRVATGGELTRLHVWPRPRGIAPLPSPRSRDVGGPAHDGAPGGVMFSSLREYVPGDDLRRVHWPSSARRGELLVREHADPGEPVSTVLLDTRSAGYPPGPGGDVGFDEAVDVAASVVLASTRSRSPVRLVTTSGLSVVGRRRQADAATFLDALAVVTRDETASLDVVATSRRGGVGTLTVVTGTAETGQLAAVASVVHRFEQVVVLRVGARRPGRVRRVGVGPAASGRRPGRRGPAKPLAVAAVAVAVGSRAAARGRRPVTVQPPDPPSPDPLSPDFRSPTVRLLTPEEPTAQPAPAARLASRVVALAVVATTAGAAGAGFLLAFDADDLIPELPVAAVLPAVLVGVARYRRRPVPLLLSVLGWVVGFVVWACYTVAAEAGGLRDRLELVGAGLANGPAQLVDVSLPAPADPTLIVVPLAATWLAAAVGAEIVARTGAALTAALPAVVVLVGATAVGVARVGRQPRQRGGGRRGLGRARRRPTTELVWPAISSGQAGATPRCCRPSRRVVRCRTRRGRQPPRRCGVHRRFR